MCTPNNDNRSFTAYINHYRIMLRRLKDTSYLRVHPYIDGYIDTANIIITTSTFSKTKFQNLIEKTKLIIIMQIRMEKFINLL